MQKYSRWWGDHPVRHGRSLFGICSLLAFETTTKIGGNSLDLLDWKKTPPDLVVNYIYINIRNWVYCRGFIVNIAVGPPNYPPRLLAEIGDEKNVVRGLQLD